MADQNSGNTFILSKSDGLYGSLLHAKHEQATGKPVQKTIDPLQIPEPEIMAYGIKR